MKIVALETLQAPAYSNMVWVRLHTDEGLVGLGETFRNPQATISYLHETCAPYLLGQDPLAIERHWHQIMYRVGNHFNGFPTRSVELRGNSAVDLALWDLAGKALQQPLYQLLGGLTHERMRIYNTCASATYNARARSAFNSQRIGQAGDEAGHAYDDLRLQAERPGELAEELLGEGITGMKIWPFDNYALANDGHYIGAAELQAGVAVVEAIRKTVRTRIDIMIEFHGLWRLQAALDIARALEPYGVFWLEDPIAMHHLDDLAEYKRSVKARVCGSENLGTLPWYREMLTRRAVDVVHFDMAWIGGLTEGRRIAAIAHAFDRPIAPHDCTGPVTLAANAHLMLATPNTLIAETVRAFYKGFYRDIVHGLPRIEGGYLYPPVGVGLGVELNPDLLQRADTVHRVSKG
ncbi:MAG: mandelate racemase/muconate lactonizing enzyme family protein [Gammaproteobacteria bacterium]